MTSAGFKRARETNQVTNAMPVISILENTDYVHYIEVDLSEDDWVDQATMGQLYNEIRSFLAGRFRLTETNDCIFKSRYTGPHGDIIEIINDSACYWLDVAVIKCEAHTGNDYESAIREWISGLPH